MDKSGTTPRIGFLVHNDRGVPNLTRPLGQFHVSRLGAFVRFGGDAHPRLRRPLAAAL